MKRTPVTSSMILSVGYEAESQTLEIEFTKGGLYHYAGVSASDHEELMAADSIGKHFIANIRDKFPASRL